MRRSFCISVIIVSLLVIGTVSITTANAISTEKAKKKFKEVVQNRTIAATFILDPYIGQDAVANMPSFTNFLIEQRFIIVDQTKRRYNPTEKLEQFIIKQRGGILGKPELAVQLAKYILKSIDKVERYEDRGNDVFKFYFTYNVEPLFSWVPTVWSI